MNNVDLSNEIITLHKDEYVHLFFERFLKCDSVSVYLLRIDQYEEFPETLGVLLKQRNRLWFTYIDAPSDEYGKGCQPIRIVNVDTSTKTVEIEFELAFDRIYESTRQRLIAHNFEEVCMDELPNKLHHLVND